ncbi:MAG: lysophospholipid acyltransferase family protein [Hellea sp.]
MRSLLFNIFFVLVTFIYAFVCAILSLLPGRKIMMASLRRYTRVMVWGMRVIAGIKVDVTGHGHIPADGPVIIAAKHQSYGDGFVVFSQFFDLSFVTGDAITKFLFIGRILTKMNAVVINNCGGEDQRRRMAETSQVVREQGRRLLIYPEGHLSKIGTQHKYRKGVYHLYKDFDCPVVPLASNLGQRWNQNDWVKHPGQANLEFLPPIMPGLEKDEFMSRLEDAIETRSIALLDMDDLGHLNPDDIGKIEENDVARAKREAREKDATAGEIS